MTIESDGQEKAAHYPLENYSLFLNRSCRLCGDYPLCEVIKPIDIIILKVFSEIFSTKRSYLTSSELRKKLIEKVINYRSFTHDTLRKHLNRLASLPFPFNYVIKSLRYRFTAPIISLHYSNQLVSNDTQKCLDTIKMMEGVIDISILNKNTLKIHYNPKITNFIQIISTLYKSLDKAPSKIMISSLCKQINTDYLDKKTVYSLNPSIFNSLTLIKKINIQCPINLHPDCYDIIHCLLTIFKPIPIEEIAEELGKGIRSIWDRIQDLDPLGLLLKIDSNDGPSLYSINPAHYLINHPSDTPLPKKQVKRQNK